MIRRRMALVFAFSCCIAFVSTALAQPARDAVWFRDQTKDGKLTKLEGEAKEFISGVEVVDGPKKTKIATADLVRIDYGNLPGVDRNTQISLIPMEDGRDPAKLAAEYGKMLRAAGTAPDKTKRYLAFREAHWQGRAAGQKLGDEFNAAGKAAADQLAAFTHTYKTSWEAWHTSREAARLYVQLGDTTSAINTLAILAGPPGKSLDLLPIEMKQDALVQLAGYSFRAGKVAEAKLVIEELSKDARLELPGLKERLAILIEVSKAPEPVEPKEGEPRIKPTEVIEKTRAAIARAKEPGARALGFNLLGDLYLAHKFPREAMYEYLWVDVVYNQDKDELIKAVSRVIDCFRLIGDEERAKQFEERLQKVR